VTAALRWRFLAQLARARFAVHRGDVPAARAALHEALVALDQADTTTRHLALA
jgi:uncharacterized protein HemY